VTKAIKASAHTVTAPCLATGRAVRCLAGQAKGNAPAFSFSSLWDSVGGGCAGEVAQLSS
jgi:hypothetical protein